MNNLIIPMAGKSSRFPNMRPKWMLTHPSGNFMVLEAIKGLELLNYNKIYFIFLKEHEDNFSFLNGFKEELDNMSILNRSEFVFLDNITKDQPETVYNAIKQANIKGSITIKDSDNYFKSKFINSNSICYYDLNKSNLIKPKNKSYIVKDINETITNIVEKDVISPYFCVGSYTFHSVEEFSYYYDKLPKGNECYISNIIYEMILDGKHFQSNLVSNYLDWGTLQDWNLFKKTYATLFVDIDGTLVLNSSAHFPPYIGNTKPIVENIEILRELYVTGRFQIILTTSRPEKYRAQTISQLKKEQIPYDNLIMSLFHSKRIIINDFGVSNPYKSCDAINLRRDSGNLKEILRDALGVDYEFVLSFE